MSWGNPWAWLGLLALGVPVLIHLLARRTARIQRFPTLRFLQSSRLLPRRHTRLTDVPLLIVRLAIVAVAVAALARPFLLTGGRQQSLARQLARVIVVDTSASMKRATASGTSAIEVARANARERAAEAQASLIVESATPAAVLPGAAQWLSHQPGRRELVVVSDFQLGTIEQADITALTNEVGLRFDPVAAVTASGPIDFQTRTGVATTTARTSLQPDRTDVEWNVQATERTDASAILQLAAPTERVETDAALDAALTLAPAPSDSARRVAIVYQTYDRRSVLLRDAKPLTVRWMGDIAAALAGQTTIDRIGIGSVDGGERLLLFTSASAGSLESAELMIAVLNALTPAAAASELEPQTLSTEVLRRWQRVPPSVVDHPIRDDDASDGRWLWALVLLLLGVETLMRRAQPKVSSAASTEAVYDRVA
ncbi:MAG: BatA domain-containing protein [Gemmatimonadota bacterium]